MYKVQLTFTHEEETLLSQKAQQLGYNVTKYIKLLIGKEVLSLSEKYPTFQLSPSAIKKINIAQEEYKMGKSIKLNGIDELDEK